MLHDLFKLQATVSVLSGSTLEGIKTRQLITHFRVSTQRQGAPGLRLEARRAAVR